MRTEVSGKILAVGDLTETLKEISEMMQRSVQLTFDESGRPGKWMPLKYRNGKPLILSGALRSSVTPESGMDYAAVTEGRGLVYAAIHQFGGTVRPKVTEKMRSFYWAKWFETKDDKWRWMALGAKVGERLEIQIPARPSLVWLEEDVELYKKMLGERMIVFAPVEVQQLRRMAA